MAHQNLEIVYFKPPQHKSQVLFVWGLPELLSWEYKWCELGNTFSKYGLLYSIYVPTEQVGYAFINYYSQTDALKALRNTDRKVTIGQNLLKVTFSSVEPKSGWPLHISKCIQLASQYLHFDGWNTKIILLEKLEAKYMCTVEIEIKHHQLCVIGSGYGDLLYLNQGGVEGIAKKRAFHRACENAFSQLALVLVSGEVATVRITEL